jgi:hypothetical protein
MKKRADTTASVRFTECAEEPGFTPVVFSKNRASAITVSIG